MQPWLEIQNIFIVIYVFNHIYPITVKPKGRAKEVLTFYVCINVTP